MPHFFEAFMTQRAQPSINNQVISQGINALISSATQINMSLFLKDPIATVTTTGISIPALTPATCSVFSAKSSLSENH